MSMSAAVTPIKAMSKHDYERERAEIEAKYPKGGNYTAMKDQALAALFARSAWTQERLAEVEGMSQRYISYRLTFGRFLEFSTTGSKPEIPPFEVPVNLTERRFREFWQQTQGEASEALRFRKCRDLIAGRTDKNARLVPEKSSLPPKASDLIIEQFADGKWHSLEIIAKAINADIDDVRKKLSQMKGSVVRNCHYESRKRGKTTQYRIVKGAGKELPISVVLQEIRPILKELDEIGGKSVAEYNRAQVRYLAHQIEKALERLAR